MLKHYTLRFATLLMGLVVFATGSYFIVNAANIGVGAWETFHLGLNKVTNISYGDCSVITSLAIIFLDIILKGKIGFGTFCNGILVGKFVGFLMADFDFLPDAKTIPVGIAYILIGQTLQGIGQVIYMSRGLGCGPRDTLMVIIGNKFPNAPIGIVRVCIEICVFAAGVLMGAPFGWGTVVAVGLASTVMQTVYKVFKFEPRSVVQEDIPTTIKVWQGKAESTFGKRIKTGEQSQKQPQSRS